MNKRIITLALIAFLITPFAYAQIRGNASPCTVELNSSTALSEEVTFPAPTRDLYIINTDSVSGIWVNLKGSDTDAVGVNAHRTYVAPSSSLELYDYATDAITVFLDIDYTGDGEASPVQVIGVY